MIRAGCSSGRCCTRISGARPTCLPTAGTAAVIDPKWEIEDYLALAEEHGFRIEHVLETHNHADHVSGHGRLANATGAAIHISAEAGVGYEHEPLADGDVVRLGEVAITALATPGHRPEHMAYLVADASRADEPWLAVTGDSLFVGDLARPDLAVEPKEGARGLYHSATAAARADRLRRGLARARRRLALRRRRDEREARDDDRLRAPVQSFSADRRRGRVRAGSHRRTSTAAPELQADRRAEPRPTAHGIRRPRAGRASSGARASPGRSDAPRRPADARVRRGVRARLDQHDDGPAPRSGPARRGSSTCRRRCS